MITKLQRRVTDVIQMMMIMNHKLDQKVGTIKKYTEQRHNTTTKNNDPEETCNKNRTRKYKSHQLPEKERQMYRHEIDRSIATKFVRISGKNTEIRVNGLQVNWIAGKWKLKILVFYFSALVKALKS